MQKKKKAGDKEGPFHIVYHYYDYSGKGKTIQQQRHVVILGHTVWHSDSFCSPAGRLSRAAPADRGPGAACISAGIYGLHFS